MPNRQTLQTLQTIQTPTDPTNPGPGRTFAGLLFGSGVLLGHAGEGGHHHDQRQARGDGGHAKGGHVVAPRQCEGQCGSGGAQQRSKSAQGLPQAWAGDTSKLRKLKNQPLAAHDTQQDTSWDRK